MKGTELTSYVICKYQSISHQLFECCSGCDVVVTVGNFDIVVQRILKYTRGQCIETNHISDSPIRLQKIELKLFFKKKYSYDYDSHFKNKSWDNIWSWHEPMHKVFPTVKWIELKLFEIIGQQFKCLVHSRLCEWFKGKLRLLQKTIQVKPKAKLFALKTDFRKSK